MIVLAIPEAEFSEKNTSATQTVGFTTFEIFNSPIILKVALPVSGIGYGKDSTSVIFNSITSPRKPFPIIQLSRLLSSLLKVLAFTNIEEG